MAVKQSKSMPAGHTAGMFADMTLDGPEIGTLVTVVDRAKNLPNRKTMGKQDPYCAMRLGKMAKKTETDRRGGQTPKWDQELRFTVHDSPDYYRLKVSVFNDDKKTDLIGEAYVSLQDLIKPGGGSNDLWHQLNYKGKYAGEIRIEMTYYDVRPREERSVERRRHREKAVSVISDAPSTVSGPRQLGPREVRRRPLPVSPGVDNMSPTTTSQTQAPPPPPKIPISQPGPNYTPPRTQQYTISSHSQDYEDVHMPPSNDYFQPTAQPYHEPELPYRDFNSEGQYNHSPHQYEIAVPSPRSLPVLSQYSPSHPEISDMWNEPGRRHSENYELNSTTTDTYNTPPPLPHASHSAPEIPQYRPHRTSVSPTKASQYRDSPLRHSISQQEVPQGFDIEPEGYDVPPPPPPRHRDIGVRNQQPEHSPSAYAPNPLRTTPRRISVDERSPLQNIERDLDPALASTYDLPRHNSYDTYTQSLAGPVHAPEQHGPYDTYSQPSPITSRAHSRQGSFDPYREPEPPIGHSSEPQPYYDDQQERSLVVQRHYPSQDQIDIYGRRNSRNVFLQEQQSSPIPHRNEYSGSFEEQQPHNPYYEANSHGSSNFSQSQVNLSSNHSTPPLIRPRPQKVIPTQTPGYVPPRKAVSPGPYPAECSRRMSEIPFGPDDYDVLNPASSPATNAQTPYETPEQARESARFREVEKLRDQGPIIGNDGRVIDPSDHLPSDTWAPEPERKQRKPEHVIHIRTRNDIKGPKSSPVSARTNGFRNPLQSSPVSPSPISTPPSLRNRLQKSTPTRPLPIQPYQQDTPTKSQPRPSPMQQQQTHRNSYHDISPGIERPSLSEYQVPVINNYSPRGPSHQTSNNHQPMPPRMAYVEDYSPGRSSDPLAAELSMIDIGPSRGGRTALRPSRGY